MNKINIEYTMNNKLSLFLLIFLFFSYNCNKDNNISPIESYKIITADYDVMLNGVIVAETGFGMGVDDSKQLRNWIQPTTSSMCLTYPTGLSWGALFITVQGDPKDPPRPWIDISACSKITVEMKGEVGDELVYLGLKDKDDPDTGIETKIPVTLTKDWKIYEFLLSSFKSCDLTKVYVVTEFVFQSNSSTSALKVYVKNIRILK